MADQDPFLTPDEVAELLRVEPKTVTQWLRAKKLGGILLAGSLWRVRKSDLEEFLARWESKPSMPGSVEQAAAGATDRGSEAEEPTSEGAAPATDAEGVEDTGE